MLKKYSFQLNVDDPSSWLLLYSMRDVFQHANTAAPEQTFQALQHVLGNANVVDHSQHENSPYRNRPAYLDDPNERFQDAGTFERTVTKIDPATPKDWDAAPKAAPPPKDWSVLGR